MIAILATIAAAVCRSSDASACSDLYRFNPATIDNVPVIARVRIASLVPTQRPQLWQATFETIETYRGEHRASCTVPMYIGGITQFGQAYGEDTIVEVQPVGGAGTPEVWEHSFCGQGLIVPYGIDNNDHAGIMESLWIKGIVPSDIDANGDVVISPEEIAVFRDRLAKARREEQNKADLAKLEAKFVANKEACGLPPVPQDAGCHVRACPENPFLQGLWHPLRGLRRHRDPILNPVRVPHDGASGQARGGRL
jgi:hypothetical protein